MSSSSRKCQVGSQDSALVSVTVSGDEGRDMGVPVHYRHLQNLSLLALARLSSSSSRDRLPMRSV
eukprot:CAMPEP_0185202078 /NCGR_PEP_ID=MMETSP1140-20130426/50429_1 /TAXON_ID=298111 /ORGANISM="Pavlova sp., Strain CCMP459" /LENGTH=64 /DNA_ID=CAMNT_0027769499 /DNA_START=23 /DNA_END=214 /DNA_ORIENTATION=+